MVADSEIKDSIAESEIKDSITDRIAKTELEDKKGYYHLDNDVYNELDYIARGFIWDLASKPPWVKWLGYRHDDPRTERAALWHDFRYLIKTMTRAEADAQYRKMSIQDGYPKRKAWVEWAILRAVGGSHWDNDSEDLALIRRMCQNWYKMGVRYSEFADWVIKLTKI